MHISSECHKLAKISLLKFTAIPGLMKNFLAKYFCYTVNPVDATMWTSMLGQYIKCGTRTDRMCDKNRRVMLMYSWPNFSDGIYTMHKHVSMPTTTLCCVSGDQECIKLSKSGWYPSGW